DRVHVTIRPISGIDGRINRAVNVKTSEIEALDQIDLGELPTHDDAAIFLQGEGQRRVVDASAESECRVNGAVGIQSRDAITGEAAEHCETAGDNDATVWLQDSGKNIAIGTDS